MAQENETLVNENNSIVDEETPAVIVETPVEPPSGTPQSTEGTPPNETPTVVIETEYYTPEEMRTLQVEGIDTSRIPPEMQPLYQAMQAPITRKSQELSDKIRTLGQGEQPPQAQQPQQPQPQPSITDIAVSQTLQSMGMVEKPNAWDEGYEDYIVNLTANTSSLKSGLAKHKDAVSKLDTFKSGFTSEQFATIDSEAESHMYKLLSDPKTKTEGQRIQQALNGGDIEVILPYLKTVAKGVLSRHPSQTTTTPTVPVTSQPSGAVISTGDKPPEKMNSNEYRAWRERSS